MLLFGNALADNAHDYGDVAALAAEHRAGEAADKAARRWEDGLDALSRKDKSAPLDLRYCFWDFVLNSRLADIRGPTGTSLTELRHRCTLPLVTGSRKDRQAMTPEERADLLDTICDMQVDERPRVIESPRTRRAMSGHSSVHFSACGASAKDLYTAVDDAKVNANAIMVDYGSLNVGLAELEASDALPAALRDDVAALRKTIDLEDVTKLQDSLRSTDAVIDRTIDLVGETAPE